MITVISDGDKRELAYKRGQALLDLLRQNGYYVTASCAGNGTCGKCKVKLIKGRVEGAIPDKNGEILSCKAILCEDITILLNTEKGSGLDFFEKPQINGEKEGFGIALDVGTTTLGACLIDLKSGEILKKTSALNPQCGYGADVLNRIKAADEGHLNELQSIILQKTRQIIDLLADGRAIEELTVSANTTMLHLFLGVSPHSIGEYPFTPLFTDEQAVDGKALGLPVKRVRTLPSASAFIGSDVTAGILACRLNEDERTKLFVDVGTNGEIVLFHGGNLYATSTAAGPALEGATIDCGLGGINGAIDGFSLKNGNLSYTTVNNQTAKGICGSGLIDLIAILVKEGLIDEYGGWNENADTPLKSSLKGDRFFISEDIYLSQRDIRRFQLAKSAVCAGIETLLAECNVDLNQIEVAYIAGGLGFYMDAQNATVSGLLPKELLNAIKAVGNTSLAGAALCLTNEASLTKIKALASEIKIVELAFSPLFQELYVEKMTF